MTHHDLTVYYDGSCPLCRLEIDHYRRQAGADRIDFVDISVVRGDPGPDLSKRQAMGRFHVRTNSGKLKSGAAAFVEIWNVLPRWRPLAAVASVPGATPALEIGYRLFQPFRPRLAKIVRQFR